MILTAGTAVVVSGVALLAAHQRSSHEAHLRVKTPQVAKKMERLFPKAVNVVPEFERYAKVHAASKIDPVRKDVIRRVRAFEPIATQLTACYLDANSFNEKQAWKALDRFRSNFKNLDSLYYRSSWDDLFAAFRKAKKVQQNGMDRDLLSVMCKLIDSVVEAQILLYINPYAQKNIYLFEYTHKLNKIVENGLARWEV